jgi:hypothetical protein
MFAPAAKKGFRKMTPSLEDLTLVNEDLAFPCINKNEMRGSKADPARGSGMEKYRR